MPKTSEKEFDVRIKYMEQQIKAWKWESSAKIMAYLNLYGKLTASELRDLLDLKGEKSIFKALKVLIDADKIIKETDPNDSRISYYYLSGKIVNDPEMDPEFLEYLHDQEKLDLIAQYYNYANMASIGLIKVLTEIIQNNFLNSDVSDNLRFLHDSLFIESVLSVEDSAGFRRELVAFLQSTLPQYISKDRDFKIKTKNPAGFYLAFMPI